MSFNSCSYHYKQYSRIFHQAQESADLRLLLLPAVKRRPSLGNCDLRQAVSQCNQFCGVKRIARKGAIVNTTISSWSVNSISYATKSLCEAVAEDPLSDRCLCSSVASSGKSANEQHILQNVNKHLTEKVNTCT